MSDHQQAGRLDRRAGRLDRRAAERILHGAGGHAPLDALLAAAAAPARPDELAGEDAAVAAFRAAARPAAGTSRAAALRRMLTIKVVAIVGASLVLTGGAAYATMTGRIPGHTPSSPASPSGYDRDGHRNPRTRYTQSPPPSRKATPTPSPSVTEKEHGKAHAPGQQKKATREPKKPKPTPTRGPGETTNPPPTENPGNGVYKDEDPSHLNPGRNGVLLG